MTKKKKNAPGAGRPKLGKPIAIVVTEEQRAWLDARIPPGGSRARAVRDLIELVRKQEEETP